MALTPRQRTVLKDWAALRIANWVYTQEYHEGIKDVDGKPVYAEGVRLVPVYSDVPPPTNDIDPIPEPVQTGTAEETYQYRTFIVRSHQMIDREEVITRLHRKALKRGMTDIKNVVTWEGPPGEEVRVVTPTEVPVRRHTIGNFFRNNRAYFRGLIPGVGWEGSNRAGRLAARTEDPDA